MQLVMSALARGDFVIATARNLSTLDIPQSCPRLHRMQLDVTDGEDILKAKLDEAARVWGRIDVLVNNAGTGILGLVEESGCMKMVFCPKIKLILYNMFRSSQLKKQFRTNVFGLLDVTTAALPHMRQRKSGTIVMMGSRLGWRPEAPVGSWFSAC